MKNRDIELDNETLEAALKILSQGLHPIPIEENGKYPLVPWEKDISTSPSREEVIEWFSTWPKANLAVITGTFFGIMALELKYGHDPWPPPGCELNSSCIVETPEEDLHAYYRAGSRLKFNEGDLCRGINILDKRCYSIIPPSSFDGLPFDYKLGSLLEGSVVPHPYWLEAKFKKIKQKQNKYVIFDGIGMRKIRKGSMRQYDLDRISIFDSPIMRSSKWRKGRKLESNPDLWDVSWAEEKN